MTSATNPLSPREVRDDLGHPYAVPATPVTRVVSLVPSLTESLATVDAGALVGVTDWCTHPGPEVLGGAARVRGTKNPDVSAIVALRPDVVVVNEEENRKLDVERLREAGLPVWVTRTESVSGAVASIRRLLAEALRWPVPGWVDEAAELWAGGSVVGGGTRLCAVVPIWRDPWMVVGRPTFTEDLLSRAGVEVLAPPGRYPHVELEWLRGSGADVVLLPDEPYVFTAEDGPEAFADSGIGVRHISGRHITWYGPSLLEAPGILAEALRGESPGPPAGRSARG